MRQLSTNLLHSSLKVLILLKKVLTQVMQSIWSWFIVKYSFLHEKEL